MDDGRNRLSHDAGCVIAGAVFFGYFLLLPKESNISRRDFVFEGVEFLIADTAAALKAAELLVLPATARQTRHVMPNKALSGDFVFEGVELFIADTAHVLDFVD